MSYQISDDDSTDSESGIRFKTDSTRKLHDASYADKVRYNSRHSSSNSSDRGYHSKSRRDHRREPCKNHRRRSRSYEKRRRSSSPEIIKHQSESRHHRHKHKQRRKKDEEDRKYVKQKTDDTKLKYVEIVSSDDDNNSNSNEFSVEVDSKTGSKAKKTYGPSLPPKRTENVVEKQEKIDISRPSSSKDDTSCNMFGPSLPPKEISKRTESNDIEKKEKTEIYGPSIPSKGIETNTLQNKEEIEAYGPLLPPKQMESNSLDNEEQLETTENLPSKEVESNGSNKTEEMETYGPSIPSEGIESNSIQKKKEIEAYGPSLPPERIESDSETYVGPAVPPGFQKSDSCEETKSHIGPALPPGFKKLDESESPSQSDNTFGPSIPDNLRQRLQEAPPPQPESDSDDDMIGPVPEGHSSTKLAHKLLEERALEMRISKLTPSGPEVPTREEWMMELPQVHAANLGLGPRQFRTKMGPDMSDRSSWTDTPQDKKKKKNEKGATTLKVDLKKQYELEVLAKRDDEQGKIVEKHKKKRKKDKSLVDMHRDKLKKKEDAEGQPERRPFDRDIDLKINRFDETQKKAIFKKAQLLDTRFSSGESKFL